jgi:hypothetical protein
LTEAKPIKYAGHSIQKNRRQAEHRTRIGAVVLRQVWGMGKGNSEKIREGKHGYLVGWFAQR